MNEKEQMKLDMVKHLALRLVADQPDLTMEQALGVSDAAVRLGITAPVHIALDTGMHRIGMAPTEENADLVKQISELPGIKIEGLFTHLYRADEKDLTTAREQVKKYHAFVKYLADRGIFPEVRHVSNSAGIMELLGTDYDMVRCGITLYGIYPSDEVDREKLAIRPVMSLKATVTYVKEIGPGDEVSYGGTFRADRIMRVATIPVGYATIEGDKPAFKGLYKYAMFWASDSVDSNMAVVRYIYVDKPVLYGGEFGKNSVRASVRCTR